MVFAHQHLVKHNVFKTSQNQITLSEKCQICDVMNHNSMALTDHQYFIPLISTDHFYKQGKYDFINISLILSAGRSPPGS
jgi:hypothetical protein